MTDTRVLSNKRVAWLLGPDTNIADYSAPTLAELQSLKNVSEATKIDGTDFNLQASDQADDRSFTDEAGAQSRSFANFGGSIEFFTPKPADQSSIFRVARNIVKNPRTRLAVAMRTVKMNVLPVAAGDEVNVFRTVTDSPAHHRSEASYSYGVPFIARDDVLVNYIVPSAAATSVAASPAGPVSLTAGGVKLLKVTYEGRIITVGASYTSSDVTVAEVTAGGAILGVASGTTDITIDYPGSAAPLVITVTIP